MRPQVSFYAVLRLALLLSAICALAATSCWSQAQAPASAAPAVPTTPSTPPAPAVATATAPPAAPVASAVSIDSVTVFQQTSSDAKQAPGPTQMFVIEIKGTGLNTTGLQVAVFPAKDVKGLATLPASAADAPTTMRVTFTAPPTYLLEEVAVLQPGSGPVVHTVEGSACDFQQHVETTFSVVPRDQAKDKYGNGIAANFYVVQLSIVNGCTIPITVPLAGIKILPRVPSVNPIPASSLDHITSLYSSDRKSTGARAIFFNVLQATATLGSAIEPFFGHGFTQGVSIWGGGFTQAWQAVFRDMSAEQLQNITSQSLGSNEKIAANGPLQKFIFVSSQCGGPTFHHFTKKNCRDLPVENALASGYFDLELQFVPASAQAVTVSAKSVPPPAGQ